MEVWMGMGSGTLPGDVFLPDDEHPGSGNIRKRIKKKRPAVKKSPPSKKKSTSRNLPINKKRREGTRKKK